ncbi:amidohydrolase/deacetylase family metallohydrolase [Tautonia sociabilis]|uniref:Amidohydrolase/deacetylase family metallohydrolase n=1 Tax=Tautonia sociabilis TaxID=2080755 RepID=A0A432MM32_9BACT|nr:amidohydrolase/deacetylase family metallohydrolase [Tautonia sociabilis]RUL88309.1 amidohydrolase/deacetylase family metallohydrolase [Tautonia sociabilis]
MRPLLALLLLLIAGTAPAQEPFDLVLRGGHVIDPANAIDAVRDVAIRDGVIAAVAPEIDPKAALKSVDVSGLYVTPGLIDLHVHVFTGTGEPGSFTGDSSVHPDVVSIRSGVTTVVDAGCAGWRNFEEFRRLVIDRSRTRVLAFLNIVGHGMRGRRYEGDLDDMQPEPAAEMARRHPDLIVGIKTAHYMGREFTAVERAVEAGTLAGLPVMVDFGRVYPEKSLEALLTEKLRPGDIYTHVYSGLRGELTPDGHANPALFEGRCRGILFDVGHGGGSFVWGVAVPIISEGFPPDTISTDLHSASINEGMKDMLNVMSKFLALGMPLDEVILRSTWNSARAIGRERLGNLSVGAPADVAVLRLEEGNFGFLDSYNARLNGDRKLTCEMTLRDGKVVYELNGLTRPDWTTLPPGYRDTGDPRWDGTLGRRNRRLQPPRDPGPPAGPSEEDEPDQRP